MANGLTPALRELKGCRHTFPSNGGGCQRASQRDYGCITCNLAARVMKDVEREQRAAEEILRQEMAKKELLWARARRDLLLTRHPTNWAGCFLLQGSRPERPTDATSDGATVADGVDVVLAAILDAGDDVTAVDREREHRERNSRSQTKDHDDEGARFREQVVDVRPKLAPGAMLTLSQLAAEAIMAFTEEVLGEAEPKERAKKAMAIVTEATSEVAFANRRDRPRTGVLVTKLQAVARGWLARRQARVLILRGGCRRELDVPSGAWQYVWSFRAGASDATVDNRRGYNVSGRGHPSSSAGGGKGGVTEEGLFRSWYPPALLKNETLPSPRAAVRRVEGEERKREARLALAKSLLDDQRAQLERREACAVRLLALADVVKLVERATASLEDAAVSCFGISGKPPCTSIRVLHPRGGQPGDGAREAVASEIMAAWHSVDTKVREQKEAARIRAERASEKRKTQRQDSPPNRGAGGGGKRTPRTDSPERRGKSGGKREAELSVPTTNGNLAEFEKRLLHDSVHEDASAAVASLLQRKRVLVAIHEASRLGRNGDAWEKTGTSPFSIGIQVLPPWAHPSHKFIALAHRGSLVAVSQASPFVFWETLANRENLGRVLRAILEPFQENADLLKAMFVGGQSPNATDPADCTTTNARRFTTSTGSKEVGIPELEARTATGQRGEESEGGSAAGYGRWGYWSSLSSRGCWKVDARTAAQRDPSVELGFDSVAFDVFIRPEDHCEGRAGAEAPSSKSRHAHAIVSNAVPFRLVDGLPRELGPLLFDETVDASLLGGRGECRPLSRGAKSEREKHPAGVEPDGKDSKMGEDQEGVEDDWVETEGPRGCGPVLSHIRRGCRPVEGVVEVRLRAKPLDTKQLARAGLPQDMSALVVDAIPEPRASGNLKLPDVAAGVSGKRQGVRRSRAVAH